MNYLNMIAFGIFPYIAIIVCFIATWVRYDREQFLVSYLKAKC